VAVSATVMTVPTVSTDTTYDVQVKTYVSAGELQTKVSYETVVSIVAIGAVTATTAV